MRIYFDCFWYSKDNQSPPLILAHWNSGIKLFLTWGQGARVDNISGILLDLFLLLSERRTRQGHQTSPGGFEDTEWSDQLQEGVDTGRLGGAVKVGLRVSFCWRGRKICRGLFITYSSTMQLFVLISSTLPPNWWVRRVMASRCSCLCRRAWLGGRFRGW